MDLIELKHMIDCFDRSRVLVIGDLMLDKFINGTVSRISPEAPVPVVDVVSESFKLGGGANAISNIRVLGGKVIAVGVVGDDWYGRKLKELLIKDGTNTECVIVCKERPTTVKTRVIAGQQQIVRIDREKRESIEYEYTKTIIDFLNEKIKDVDAILISDYDKGMMTNELLEKLIPLAKKFCKPIVVHPKLEHCLDYKGVTIVITNIEKATTITGIRHINETSIRNMGQWLLTHIECEYVLITRGREGMSLFEKRGNVAHIPANAKKMHDITGADDTVSSLIALSLASGFSNMVNSAILANIAIEMGIEMSAIDMISKDKLKNQIISSIDLFASK